MIFNQTFNDPTKHIYYPRTWGGKTSVELFEEMKLQLWYLVLVVVVKTIIGCIWWGVLYAYYKLLRQLARLRKLHDQHPEKLENAVYLGEDFRFRWIMVGLILTTITLLWINFQTTREALLYGFGVWALGYLFRKPLLVHFQNIKTRWFGLHKKQQKI